MEAVKKRNLVPLGLRGIRSSLLHVLHRIHRRITTDLRKMVAQSTWICTRRIHLLCAHRSHSIRLGWVVLPSPSEEKMDGRQSVSRLSAQKTCPAHAGQNYVSDYFLLKESTIRSFPHKAYGNSHSRTRENFFSIFRRSLISSSLGIL